MTPIAIFYHCLFVLNTPENLLERACKVVHGQMRQVIDSGLSEAATEFVVGINGGKESEGLANLFLPKKAKRVFHGLGSRSENLTLVELEKWLPGHPGWNVLYFHSKGAINQAGGADFSERWSRCMMRNLVEQWRRCIVDLTAFESVGCHWMPGMCDGTQNIWAGNFWWAQSDFLRTLPSIFERPRIKQSGIESIESRYESEVWIGNGKRVPTTKDYHPNGPFHARCD